jgi:hypothetical protein
VHRTAESGQIGGHHPQEQIEVAGGLVDVEDPGQQSRGGAHRRQGTRPATHFHNGDRGRLRGVVSRDPGQTGRTQPLPVPGRSGRVHPQRAADPGPGLAWRRLGRVKERQIQLGEAVPGIPDTVHKWRRRLLAERLDGLVDEPRPGRPPTIGVDQVEAVVVTTLEQLPKNATHWWPDHLVRTRSSGGSATWPTR